MNGARVPWLAASLFLVCAGGVTARAQVVASGQIHGVVIDSTGRRLSSVRINLLGTKREAVTDSVGAFGFGALEPGEYALIIRRLGFEPLLTPATVARDVTDLLITLSPEAGVAIPLDTVVTTATATEMRPGLREMEEHRKLGVGQYVTRKDIEEHPGSTTTSLMRAKVQGLQYIRHCRSGYAVASRDTPSLSNKGAVGEPYCSLPAACYAQVFVDGIRIYSFDPRITPPNLDDFKLQDVEAIEVFRGAETPQQYNATGSACGTVLVWLRR